MNKLPLSEIVAETVREYRLKQGMSQEKLSFESGLHRTYISLIERGQRRPTVETLGVRPSELMSTIEKRNIE